MKSYDKLNYDISSLCIFPGKETKRDTYCCPQEDCSKEFRNKTSLDEHLLLGDCEMVGKQGLMDKSKLMYSQKLQGNAQLTCPTLHPKTRITAPGDIPEKGWALKEMKNRKNFTDEQRDFMLEKFQVGKRTGSKVDPYVAAEEMRSCGQFARTSFLTGKQINSFFSRLSQKERKTDKFDIKAAKEETRRSDIKKEILSILKK